MSETDTIEFLNGYCNFEEKRVYVLFAIARKNENEDITTSGEIIFREVLKNETDIRRKVSKLRAATAGYEADIQADPTFRLYVTVNRRDAESALFNFRQRTEGWIQDYINDDDAAGRKFERVDSYWVSELQKPENRGEQFFLWDYDGGKHLPGNLRHELETRTTILAERETPNGRHVVTLPFRYMEDNPVREYDLELKTDGMLFLEYLT